MDLPPGWNVVYPIEDVQTQWHYPGSPTLHFDKIDEGLEPPDGPNDVDHVRSDADNKIDSYLLSAGLPGLTHIYKYWWQFRYAGSSIPNDPGLTIQLWVAGILRGQVSYNVATGGTGIHKEGQAEFDVDITGVDWYAGPRMIKHISVIPAGGGWGDPKFKQNPS